MQTYNIIGRDYLWGISTSGDRRRMLKHVIVEDQKIFHDAIQQHAQRTLWYRESNIIFEKVPVWNQSNKIS